MLLFTSKTSSQPMTLNFALQLIYRCSYIFIMNSSSVTIPVTSNFRAGRPFINYQSPILSLKRSLTFRPTSSSSSNAGDNLILLAVSEKVFSNHLSSINKSSSYKWSPASFCSRTHACDMHVNKMWDEKQTTNQ